MWGEIRRTNRRNNKSETRLTKRPGGRPRQWRNTGRQKVAGRKERRRMCKRQNTMEAAETDPKGLGTSQKEESVSR